MDDLISLDWSSSPSSSSTKPAPPPLSAPPRPTPSSFDFLAQPKAQGNGVNYHSSTPSTPNLPPALQSRLQPQASGSRQTKSGSATPASAVSASAHDAFSSLLSLNGSQSTENKSLSLAQRQAQGATERQRQADYERAQFEANSSFWDNLGNKPQSSVPLQPTPSGPVTRPPSAAPNLLAPSWDDDLLGGGASSSSTTSVRKLSPQAVNDPFDFDALAARTSQLKVDKISSGMRTPESDFDFGENRQSESDEEEDVLGDLSRPVRPLSEAVERSPPPRQRAPAQRSRSPPPHVLGQLVQMGFSVDKARAALASTPSGVDVEAAIESLVAQQPRRSPEDREDDMRRQEEEERRRRRRAGPSRDSVKARTKEEIGRASAPTVDSADKFIAQASEIGQSMLGKATLLWNTGKEKALKAYEEQRRAMDTDRPREPRKDGRPRWMVDAETVDRQEDVRPGFKDDSDPEDHVVPVRRTTGQSRPAPSPPGPSRPPPVHRNEPRRNLLDVDDQPSSRAPPIRAQRTPPPRSTPPPRPSTPLIKRKLIDATPAQSQAAQNHKATGNEHFKLGRFPEAEAAYSRAITSLPEGHLLLVPLYNNRAAARLKAGDSANAIQDATVVVNLIGLSYHPAKEEPLPLSLANDVKLSDALVKAIIKRAQAAEMAEKWSLAAEDWERIVSMDSTMLGSGSASTRNLAVEGGRRCRKMISTPAPAKPAAVSQATRPRPPASRSADLNKSEAVAELRKAAAANEAEEAQRLAIKDKVDARVQAWKSGKEENLRALIASLDTVLWDDILAGGLKVGMHELIQDKQVKIKYMKVIARLHPDKLNVSNTTVEQRMLASAVFGILSDAWQSFSKA